MMRRTPMKRTAFRAKPSDTLPAKAMKTCEVCGTEFEKRSMGHRVCKPACAAKLVKRDTTSRKEAVKTYSQYAQETQKAINALVRYRDRNDGCISCNKPSTWQGQWHASHYKSVGSSPALRFDLTNIHKACSICNNWKSGNIGEYRPRLLQKIGFDELARLEGPQPSKKYEISDLVDLKKWAIAELKKLKELKK